VFRKLDDNENQRGKGHPEKEDELKDVQSERSL